MKTTNLLKFLGALSIFALISLSFTWSEKASGNDWTLISTQSGISTYVMQSDCGNQDLFLFKLENTTGSTIGLKYTMSVLSDPTFPPITKTLVLKGNEVATGTCDDLWEMALPNAMKSSKSLKEQVAVTISINQ